MKSRRSGESPKAPLPDEKRQDAPARQQQPGEAPAGKERRGRHRVADDQQSGAGSQSALSKLMMLERKRAALLPRKE
jgi:hypothetical protein